MKPPKQVYRFGGRLSKLGFRGSVRTYVPTNETGVVFVPSDGKIRVVKGGSGKLLGRISMLPDGQWMFFNREKGPVYFCSFREAKAWVEDEL